MYRKTWTNNNQTYLTTDRVELNFDWQYLIFYDRLKTVSKDMLHLIMPQLGCELQT
jgi:hypothetical protein